MEGLNGRGLMINCIRRNRPLDWNAVSARQWGQNCRGLPGIGIEHAPESYFRKTSKAKEEDRTVQQRRFTRIPFDTKVFVKANNRSFAGFSMNISVRGIFIKTSEILELGDTVDIEVIIPSASQGSMMRISCSVIRLEKNGAALEFRKMDPEAFHHLRNVLNRRSTHRLKPFMGF